MSREQEIHNMFEPTIENVQRDVCMSRLLFLSKNGKLYSGIAEQYIKKLEGFAEYCREEAKERWKSEARTVVYCFGYEGVDNQEVAITLRAYERTGVIMMAVHEKKTANQIADILNEQNNDENTRKHMDVLLERYATDDASLKVFEADHIIIKRKKNKGKKNNQEQS